MLYFRFLDKEGFCPNVGHYRNALWDRYKITSFFQDGCAHVHELLNFNLFEGQDYYQQK